MKDTGVKFMADRVSYKEMVELYNQGFNRLESKMDSLGVKIDNVDDKVDKTHIQVTKTNGRVTVCESKNTEHDLAITNILKRLTSQDEKLIKYGLAIAIIVTIIYYATGIVIPFL